MQLNRDLIIQHWIEEIQDVCKDRMAYADTKLSEMLVLKTQNATIDFDDMYDIIYKGFDDILFCLSRMSENIDYKKSEYDNFQNLRKLFRIFYNMGKSFDEICESLDVTEEELFSTYW